MQLLQCTSGKKSNKQTDKQTMEKKSWLVVFQPVNGQNISLIWSLKKKDIKAMWQKCSLPMLEEQKHKTKKQAQQLSNARAYQRRHSYLFTKVDVIIIIINWVWWIRACHQKLTGVAPFLSKGGPMLLFFGGIYFHFVSLSILLYEDWGRGHIGVSKSFLHPIL